ncbi:MAG: DUF488 domain-containing protein [Beutenbergiaceae bacterium]
MHVVAIGRVYDQVDPAIGRRILVDRLWPRGLRKDDLRIGTWFPDAAPSTQLRRWYSHDQERFAEFTQRYRIELAGPAAAGLEQLRAWLTLSSLQLVTASKDLDHSEAAVLAQVLHQGSAAAADRP